MHKTISLTVLLFMALTVSAQSYLAPAQLSPVTPSTHLSTSPLHQGLNASVNLSVMAGFGKGAPKGAGFAQNVTATYVAPLGKRAWLTAGGYINHLNWDGINVTNGGLYGELGYQFNDHLTGYVYGQKSLVNSGMQGYGGYYGYPGYLGRYSALGYYDSYPGYNAFGDKLGAALRWTPNPNFSLQISVEKNWWPKPTSGADYSIPRSDWRMPSVHYPTSE